MKKKSIDSHTKHLSNHLKETSVLSTLINPSKQKLILVSFFPNISKQAQRRAAKDRSWHKLKGPLIPTEWQFFLTFASF